VPFFEIYFSRRISWLAGIGWLRGLDKILLKTGFGRFLRAFYTDSEGV
jgi:hypothetical protein